MNRYLVERTFPHGLAWAMGDDARATCASIVAVNAACGVTWIHSYVSADQRKIFCIYDAPTPDAIRRAAERNGLPLDRVTEVRLLYPYAAPA